VRPLLLLPCPVRYLDAGITRWFRCVPLERGARLRPLRIRGPAGHADGAGERAPDVPPATADLLAALAPGARTEPPLLHRLRLLLAGRGADIGCEQEVWSHPGVFADELACALRPFRREEAGRSFERLPPELQAALVRARREGSRHLSPLVRLEEALIGGPWLEPQELGDALVEACRYAASLHRPRGAGLRQPLSAYIAGLGQRRRELLGQNRTLAVAWAIARREELRAGTLDGIPPGIDLADLRWLLAPGGEAVPVYLGQIGGELGLFPARRGQPACRLVELRTAEDYWQVRGLETGDQGEAPPPRVRRLGATLALDTGRRYALTAGRERLELEAVRRPPWAAGMGRDGDGLFLELAERRLYWVPKGPIAVEGVELELPHGFWWDQGEHAAWLQAGRRLERPGWAVRHGVDPYGRWAQFEVQGVAQRMRWIPPGEFTMGSPEDEPERLDNEAQHPVILTRGLWLADTACTQALWRAVLGEGPSLFEGDERPVEQVSWEGVAERFLPALNDRVPGLDAALPTEAQWEYACRAGTTTPFWFGDNISPEQVNYNGSNPYAGGAKGEYRERTVEVKALPANGWGLYQMHGNVWEWCADWLGEYPREAVVDPEGPETGRRRVLRGGSWFGVGGYCRSAGRDGDVPGYRYGSIGFRLSRGLSPRQVGSAGEGGAAAERGARGATPDAPAR
jgi:formylglycine-generating enzyme required for sulfatase activity